MPDDEVYLEDEPMTEDDEADDEAVAEDDEAFSDILPFLPFGSLFSGRQRPPKVAQNRSYFSPRRSFFVSQTQFAAALANIRSDIGKNASAIRTVSARVATQAAVNARQNRAIVKQSKIVAKHGKDIAGLRNDVKKASDMNLMLFLLTQPKSLSATTDPDTVGGVDVPAGTRFQIGSGTSPILLFFLLSSMGGGGGFGSDNLMSLFLLLTLSGSNLSL
jgi:hypothetical protein